MVIHPEGNPHYDHDSCTNKQQKSSNFPHCSSTSLAVAVVHIAVSRRGRCGRQPVLGIIRVGTPLAVIRQVPGSIVGHAHKLIIVAGRLRERGRAALGRSDFMQVAPGIDSGSASHRAVARSSLHA